jgi:hypothetical protein
MGRKDGQVTAEVKIIAALGLLIAILGGLWWYGEHRYNLGLAAGKAEIQTAWDVDKANIQKVTDAAIAQANAQKDAALQANEVIANGYAAKLSAAQSSVSTLASQLRDTRTRLAAHQRSLPQAPNNPGAPTGTATSSPGLLDVAIANTVSECAAVRAGYEALIAEITRQL